jgi:ribonuclease J
MKILIHRGANQIGGCITEIQSAAGTRILIDLGHNLPGESEKEDKFDDPANLSALLDGVSGIIYTHNHGDHLGFYHQVPETIPQYIGHMSKDVVLNILDESLNKADRSGRKSLIEEIQYKASRLKAFRTYVSGHALAVGDIRITPYFVSHSAADSHMLLIECDDKRVVHTGDLREHGFLGKGLEKILRKYLTDVDALITEGTMLSRDDEHTKSESEIQSMMEALMTQYKNVFVLCSSTNFDRLAGLHKANARFKGRPFVCDVYQNRQFKTLTSYSGKYSDLYVVDDAVEMSLRKVNLHKKMIDKGFTMVVRDNPTFRKWIGYLKLLLNPAETVLVYSQYKGYLNDQPKLQEFVKMFECNVEYVHTSGHATRKTLAKICTIVNPKSAIVPIHKASDADLRTLDISDELKNKVVDSTAIINEIRIQID